MNNYELLRDKAAEISEERLRLRWLAKFNDIPFEDVVIDSYFNEPLNKLYSEVDPLVKKQKTMDGIILG